MRGEGDGDVGGGLVIVGGITMKGFSGQKSMLAG